MLRLFTFRKGVYPGVEGVKAFQDQLIVMQRIQLGGDRSKEFPNIGEQMPAVWNVIGKHNVIVKGNDHLVITFAAVPESFRRRVAILRNRRRRIQMGKVNIGFLIERGKRSRYMAPADTVALLLQDCDRLGEQIMDIGKVFGDGVDGDIGVGDKAFLINVRHNFGSFFRCDFRK